MLSQALRNGLRNVKKSPMIYSQFINNVQKYADKKAIIYEETSLNYKEVNSRVNALAIKLQHLGVSEGEHVAVTLNNSSTFLVLLLSIAKINAVIVPLSPSLKEEALWVLLQNTDSKYIILNDNHAKFDALIQKIGRKRCLVEQDLCALPEIDTDLPNLSDSVKNQNDETDFILTTTSGSTSEPKPFFITQECKIKRIEVTKKLYQLNDSVVSIVSTPMHHSLALRLSLLPILSGGTSVIMKNFNPVNWLDTVGKHKVNFSILVSSQIKSILKSKHKSDISSLKNVISSSEALGDSDRKDFVNFFKCRLHEIYGTSETATVTNNEIAIGYKLITPSKINSVGKALPNTDIRVINDKGEVAGINEIGEITCKTPTLINGYYKKGIGTKAIAKDEYFCTGDLGLIDDEGFLYFVSRKKDIIITGGINVYPKDVESVLMQSGELSSCAVIGVADNNFGEAILALIVPKEKNSFKLGDLRKYCFNKLDNHQQPLGYITVDELPKNKIGKVDRKSIKNKYQNINLTEKLPNS